MIEFLTKNPGMAIAGAAFVFSIVSILISIWASKYIAKIGVKPILVFVYDADNGWTVTNIGNGPALNVIFAQKKKGMTFGKGKWIGQTRLPPIAVGGEYVLDWTDHDEDQYFGACYKDIDERRYHTVCGDDHNHVRTGFEKRLILDNESVGHWTRLEEYRKTIGESSAF